MLSFTGLARREISPVSTNSTPGSPGFAGPVPATDLASCPILPPLPPGLAQLKALPLPEQLGHLLDLYTSEDLDLGLVSRFFQIRVDDFLRALGERLGLGFDELDLVDDELFRLYPPQILREGGFLPFGREGEHVLVACSRPSGAEALTGRGFVRLVLANPFKIAKELKNYEIKLQLRILETKAEQEAAQAKIPDEQGAVAEIFTLLIKQAIKERASDIHIEPDEEGRAWVRFRVDGILCVFIRLARVSSQGLVFYAKLVSRLNIDETRLAQDGSFGLAGVDYDFRLSTLPLIHGEGMVVRILSRRAGFLNLSGLDLGEAGFEILSRQIRIPQGLILLTGPTGSGKSTTLYACLNEIKSIKKKFITLEDPVEYKLPGISQISLSPKMGFDFSQALRAILRQDPDVLMLGEIRDEPSLEVAIKAALTGHLLLSTLHTNDSLSTLDRLIDMRAKPYLIASTVKLIIAQRLFRRLCPHCRYPDPREWPEFGGGFFDALGCEACSYTGFLGRALVGEFLLIDEELAGLIRHGAGRAELLALARRGGFETMMEAGLKRARAGQTSVDELLRVLG